MRDVRGGDSMTTINPILLYPPPRGAAGQAQIEHLAMESCGGAPIITVVRFTAGSLVNQYAWVAGVVVPATAQLVSRWRRVGSGKRWEQMP